MNPTGKKKSLVQFFQESLLKRLDLKFERIRDLYSGETQKLLAEAMVRGSFQDRDEAIEAALQAYLNQPSTQTREAK